MITLALENLFARVHASFVLNQINAQNVFGWREVSRIDSPLPRVVWTPGDTGGALGELGGARNPGQSPQPLANLGELFTVHVIGFDTRDPENEQAQYHVTRMLYETWLVAVYRAACGTFRMRSQTWVKGKTTDRSFGMMLRAVCSVDAPIVDALPDEPLVGELDAGKHDAVEVPVSADLTMELNDQEDDDA